jgi:tRNA-specific 2-thiouridylase
MEERVVIAMSGGVDSSVAAALLKSKGHEVIGVTMCFNLTDSTGKRPACCGVQGIEDARRVAHKLNIRHYVVNMQDILNERVIKNFCQEYLRGRTPNPCVRCNQYVKFDALLKKTLSLDARFLATGHYARIIKTEQGYQLQKARDLLKDQSYFLYRLTKKQLRHILFPLGDYTKVEVRKLAREFSLPVADKLASQEICFLPNADYREFLKKRIKKEIKPGMVVDKQGNVLGGHKGIIFYTVGQREGLGIAKGYPIYITKIDHKNNRITVGKKEDAFRSEFLIREPHFIFKAPKKKIAAKVKIRYNHKEASADIIPSGHKVKVSFKSSQFAITPGQSAVFYDKDRVLGGGIIDKVSDD